MPNARDLRLQADYEHTRALADGSGGRLVIEATKGRPPDEYTLAFHCRSIEALRDGKPMYRAIQRARVRLLARYPSPSAPPHIEMLTPVFNPHVYANRVVCMGSWQTSEYLEDVILRLGAMLQFDRRYMDVLDPANEQAMYWVSQNLLLLPTDHIAFRGEDAPVDAKPKAASLRADGLPSMGDLMRRATQEEAEFTGLTEDTSLVWQDIE